jgi:hypothetical protein
VIEESVACRNAPWLDCVATSPRRQFAANGGIAILRLEQVLDGKCYAGQLEFGRPFEPLGNIRQPTNTGGVKRSNTNHFQKSQGKSDES